MKELVLGTAFYYDSSLIEPFAVSLRKHYEGGVLLLLNKRPSHQLKKLFYENDIQSFIPGILETESIQTTRYSFYAKILNERLFNAENIFLTDVRDVIFQSSPFDKPADYELEFFLEPELIGNCRSNTSWITQYYGSSRATELKDSYISCSGTTRGTRAGIIKYLEEMIQETSRLQSNNIILMGWDQASHNHLIYQNRFPNSFCWKNGEGIVQTFAHQKVFIFNHKGQLLNNDYSVCPVIHQYDRYPEFFSSFRKNGIPVRINKRTLIKRIKSIIKKSSLGPLFITWKNKIETILNR